MTPAKSTPKKGPSERPSGRAGKKILIVEDERPLAHALDLKFTHEGFQTEVADDGAAALEAVKSEKYDIVLLDLIMPRMDGFTFLEEIQKHKIKTKVIILTNLGQDEDRKRAIALGALAYYVKANTPITEIVNKVKEAI